MCELLALNNRGLYMGLFIPCTPVYEYGHIHVCVL